MSKRMWIVLIVCLVVFGGIFGFKWFVGMKINEFFNNMPVRAATITTAVVAEDEWALTLDAVGTVKAANGINVTSRVAGFVDSIRFESGDKVEKGDILLTLESSADRATLNSLKAAAKLAQQNLDRYQRLYERGSVSRSLLDKAKSQRDQAQAQVAAQRSRLGFKTIRAPFSGELGIRQVDQGQYVTPGMTLVTLQSLSPVFVNFSLPEQAMPKIQAGQKVRVTLSSQPDEAFIGKVTAVEPGVDPMTRNFNIQASFSNDKQMMRPGMFASVSVQLPQSEQVVVVPRTAISYHPYGNLVYVVEEKSADETPESKQKTADENTSQKAQEKQKAQEQLVVHSRFVKLGRSQGDLVVVKQGLEPGEVVASTGLLKLRNGLPVKVDNSNQPPSELNPHPANG